MGTIIYTVIFDNYDELSTPLYAQQLRSEAKFICFTDNITLQSDFYEVRLVKRKYQDPTQENRYYKLMAHEVLPPHELSIYVDGNILLRSPSIKDVLKESFPEAKDIALLRHPFRDCVYEEGEACIQQGKDNPEIVALQLSKYKSQNFPVHHGLWACTIIFRRNTEAIREFCNSWWHEMIENSKRDQLALPYVLWKTDFNKLHTFEWTWYENDFYKRLPHGILKKSRPIFELNSSVSTYIPKRISEPLAWIGHIPFVMWLIEHEKPGLVVELGTHTGNSFFAICQSMKINNPHGKVYGIDSWEGDKHSGYYGDDVYQDVFDHTQANYKGVGNLVRDDFNNTVHNFKDDSIDILHIDGFHTKEAVKNDFETWLPKLKTNAIVLFHDTMVFHDDFGVNLFWKEICQNYPLHYNFSHSNGLGVVSMSYDKEVIMKLVKNSDLQNLFKSYGECLFTCALLYFSNEKLENKYKSILNSRPQKIRNLLKSLIR